MQTNQRNIKKKGRQIVLLGSIGQGKADELFIASKKTIEAHFSWSFLQKREELLKEQGRLFEALLEIEGCHEVFSFHEEPIYDALFRIAEEKQSGLWVDVSKITIAQITIEICELFDVDPYSEGCMAATSQNRSKDWQEKPSYCLVLTDFPRQVLELAQKWNIVASPIGELNDTKQRILQNKEMIRFLTPPRA